MQQAQTYVLGKRGPGGWSYPCTQHDGGVHRNHEQKQPTTSLQLLLGRPRGLKNDV